MDYHLGCFAPALIDAQPSSKYNKGFQDVLMATNHHYTNRCLCQDGEMNTRLLLEPEIMSGSEGSDAKEQQYQCEEIRMQAQLHYRDH